MGALYFASTGKWRNYALCIVGALIWKEDVALATGVLGLAVALGFRQIRIGLVTIIGSVAWFAVATKLIIPYFSPSGAVFDSLFGPFGSSATELVRNAGSAPVATLDHDQVSRVLRRQADLVADAGRGRVVPRSPALSCCPTRRRVGWRA